jgi:uracil-DNA glycosylase
MTFSSESLVELAVRAQSCRKCYDAPEGAPLQQEPRPLFQVSEGARICIASQAPGIRAHDTGLPFNDPSGDRLRAWMDVTRSEFYDEARVVILPMGFCFPGHEARGSDLPPRRECAPMWRARFFSLLPQVELILCIGQYAQTYHLGRRWRGSVTETVKDWRGILSVTGTPALLPLPHPSWRNSGWLKRNPWFESELLPVLQADVRRLLDCLSKREYVSHAAAQQTEAELSRCFPEQCR